jgi:hypothetical protein
LSRNCLLNHVIEGKTEGRIEVTGRCGRRCTQLLDNLEGRRGHWKFKQEALDRTVWRTGFGRRYGPVERVLNECTSAYEDKQPECLLHKEFNFTY